MNRRLIVILIFSLFSFLINSGESAHAVEENLLKIDPDIKTLVIFTSESGEMDEHQRLLDLALGHFTENITYKSSEEITPNDLEGKTHLVYYGQAEATLPLQVSQVVSSFEGPTMAMGHNIEQLGESYSFLKVDGEAVVTQLDYVGDEAKTREIEPNLLVETTSDESATPLVQGRGQEGQFPLITHSDKNYYYASDTLLPPYSVYFSQALNTFFDKETIDVTPAYIRLEDVHPLSDPEHLMDVAEELAARDIPYLIAVIPVYTNSETGKDYHFGDSPEVLDALRYMQANGGSVVLHGYTHQFRESETGEGFEFWDVEHQSPIYHGPEEDFTLLSPEDFQNQEDYDAYMEANKQVERTYIEDRLTRGVQELTNYGIYPLAFEAPHYTMSQHGYTVVSDMFSTYVGQIQLSDENWEIMNSTPYASKPTMLNGMRLLPETIGYVQPESEIPVEEMMTEADLYQVTEGGMVAGFYHPYLGVAGLQELLNEMEQIENIEWIDLKEGDNTVSVDNVTIRSQNGEVQVEVDRLGLMTTSLDFPLYHFGQIIIRMTRLIAIISSVAVLVFVGFIFYQRRKHHA